MAQRPSTPVKVPSSAANHTPATLDPDLRSQINTVLLRDGHVTKIQEALLHALNANSANWPTAIQSHALNLLRSGEITTFPALLRRVLDDVRQASASSSSASSTSASSSSSSSSSAAATSTPASSSNINVNDKSSTNGDAIPKKSNGASSSSPSAITNERLSLAVPSSVVEEALKTTRECLEAICEIDDKAS